MNKYDIFKHITDSMLLIGRYGGFKTLDTSNKAVITEFLNPTFNYVSVGNVDSNQLIVDLINKKIPFICLPQRSIEKKFQTFCEQHQLIKADDIIAHEFNNLASWNYKPDPYITIKEIKDENDLLHFDHISSIAFQHPPKMALEYLRQAFGQSEFSLFLALYEGNPVGCGMLALVNNSAGLYWGGVLPEYRKKGIGSELSKYRMSVAKEKNFKSICAQNMTPSVRYYQKIGFKPKGSLPLYIYMGKN